MLNHHEGYDVPKGVQNPPRWKRATGRGWSVPEAAVPEGWGRGGPEHTEKPRSSAWITFRDSKVRQIPDRHQQPPLGSFKLISSTRASKMPQHHWDPRAGIWEAGHGQEGGSGSLRLIPKAFSEDVCLKTPQACLWTSKGRQFPNGAVKSTGACLL